MLATHMGDYLAQKCRNVKFLVARDCVDGVSFDILTRNAVKCRCRVDKR
jgi:hypothetical protein